MKLFLVNFKRLVTHEKIHKNEVKVKVVGKLDLIPDNVKKAIHEAEEATAHYNKRLLNIAIGYDGRLEIIDSIKKIIKEVQDGKITIDDVDEDLVNKNLYTAGLADPNLIIRTSGEERLSGFLLWQSSYSELYFCESLWFFLMLFYYHSRHCGKDCQVYWLTKLNQKLHCCLGG